MAAGAALPAAAPSMRSCNISGAEDIAESGFPMTIIVAAPTAMPARPKSAGDHEGEHGGAEFTRRPSTAAGETRRT